MDKKQQISNLLGIAKRAGKIISGEELVIKSNYYEIAVSTLFTEIELSHAIGQNRKVIALVDDGFAKKMESLMNN